MLKRYLLPLWLVMLFAVTQIGMASHEIGHFNDLVSHGQSDSKHSGEETCPLCLNADTLDNALPAETALLLPSPVLAGKAPVLPAFHHTHPTAAAYAARGPPVFIL